MTLTGWAVDELKADAQVIRQSIGSLIGSAGGLVAAGALEVTQKGTPNMSVQIKGGTPSEGGVWIPGYTSATGPYYFQNSATYEQVIEAAGASNPRVDTIVARMYDNALDSSGKNEPVFEALKGKEETGVTLANKKGIATLPKNCYVRAYVLVPAKATSIITADIENVGTRVELPNEAIGGKALAKGAEGAVSALTITAYKATSGTSPEEPVSNTEYEASATRPVLINLTCRCVSGTLAFTVTVGGVTLPNGASLALSGTAELSQSFEVPAGVKWKVVQAGSACTFKAKYLPR